MIIADTSGLLALFNRRELRHADVVQGIGTHPGPLVVSPYVVAELAYLAATRFGAMAELAILRELGSGAYEHPGLANEDLLACADLIEKYREQEIGTTDASLVVLARRYRTKTVLTLDRRHFGVIRPLDGGRFKLLPGGS